MKINPVNIANIYFVLHCLIYASDTMKVDSSDLFFSAGVFLQISSYLGDGTKQHKEYFFDWMPLWDWSQIFQSCLFVLFQKFTAVIGS